MAKIDPFVIQWPRAWIEDPEIGPVVHYLNRFLHDLFLAVTNGTGDAGAESINDIFGAGIAETKKLNIVELTAGGTAITTTGDELIVCNNTAQATVTLNASPDDGEDCVVARRDAKVIVSGAINGGSTFTINGQYSSMHFKFSIDAAEWVII